MNDQRLKFRIMALIADRAIKGFEQYIGDKKKRAQWDIVTDIVAVNKEKPLDLPGLLAADDLDFNHDIAGIMRNLNRSTGKLENSFVPRHTMQNHIEEIKGNCPEGDY